MENSTSQTPHAAEGGSLRGRFSEATDEFVQVFTASIDFDQRLYREDIAGSIEHATMLESIDVFTKVELDQIVTGLAIQSEGGNLNGVWTLKMCMNIEHRLIELIGDTGKKLHTGVAQRPSGHRHVCICGPQ